MAELDHWAEDADWPVADWQYDVANGDTRLSYWQWVDHNRDTAAEVPSDG